MFAPGLAFILAVTATCALAGAAASGLRAGWLAACALRTAGWGLSAGWLAARA